MEVVGAVDKLISGGGSAALRANWPKAGGEAPRLLTPNSTEGKHPPNSTRFKRFLDPSTLHRRKKRFGGSGAARTDNLKNR